MWSWKKEVTSPSLLDMSCSPRDISAPHSLKPPDGQRKIKYSEETATIRSMPLLVFIAALVGFSFGSFGSVLLHRVAKGEMPLGRSQCPTCKVTLRAFDLVPILSFFFLQGRCRSCKEKISWRYPFLEAMTALLATLLLVTQYSGMPPVTFFFLSVAAYLLLIIAFYDAGTQSIPDVFLTSAFLSALLFRVLLGIEESEALRDGFLGGAIPFLFFGALWIGSRKQWIGSGDIFLGVTIGLLLGVKLTLLALFLAYTGGAIIALCIISLQGRGHQRTIAFGPFLAGGALGALFFGEKILEWYGGLLV